MVEWNELLVLGTSHFGGVGSSPIPIILLTFLKNLLPLVFCPNAVSIFYPYSLLLCYNLQAGWTSGLRRSYLSV